MPWPTESEHQDLIARFHEGTVPASEFTHAAHLVVGLWHAASFDEATVLAQALLSSPLAQREALFNSYSKDRLMSVAARRDWVEPDLQPLDFRLKAEATEKTD